MTDRLENRVTLPAWIRVWMPDDRVEEMKLETYLAGAVAAELGINAPLEALKAQAVASRTYVVSARRHAEHNADVCATAHCQKWKRVDPVTAPDVFRALTETWGMVAAYDSELIQAFFFEHCDGHTRNAEAMLMPASPYLRGVSCPCGFLTLKGHGVGMCKRGAIVMARRGASFEQILSHYYRGVSVIRIESANHIVPELEEVKPPRAPEPVKKMRAPRKPALPAIKHTKAETSHTARLASPPTTPPVPAKPVAPITEPDILVEPVHVEKPETIEPIVPVVQPMEAIVEPSNVAPAEPPQQIVEPAPAEPTKEISTSVSEEIPAQSAVPVIDEANLPALEEVVVGTGKRMHVDHLPGARMIAGALPRAGVRITIYDARGAQTVVFSGSAPHYGNGGFETIVAEDGTYLVSIDGHLIEVHLQDETVFIHAD
jgi:hypothetical protein